ncbi:MAG TPA: hypothetical protein VFO58_08515 [Vicinamibacterales bacterium]|nr:hypothetical protein [Vicinamibacterales bacterium]
MLHYHVPGEQHRQHAEAVHATFDPLYATLDKENGMSLGVERPPIPQARPNLNQGQVELIQRDISSLIGVVLARLLDESAPLPEAAQRIEGAHRWDLYDGVGRNWLAEAKQYVTGQRQYPPSPEHVIAALEVAENLRRACDERDSLIAFLLQGENHAA